MKKILIALLIVTSLVGVCEAGRPRLYMAVYKSTITLDSQFYVFTDFSISNSSITAYEVYISTDKNFFKIALPFFVGPDTTTYNVRIDTSGFIIGYSSMVLTGGATFFDQVTVKQGIWFGDGTHQTTAGGGAGATTVFENIPFSIDGTIGKDTLGKGQAPYHISTTSGVIDSIMVSLSTDTTSGLLWVNLEVSTDDGNTWTPVCTSSVTIEAGERSSNTSSINYLIDTGNDDVNPGDKVRLRVGNVPIGAVDLSVTARKRLD